MSEQETEATGRARARDGLVTWLIAPVLIIVAAWFLFGADGDASEPDDPTPAVAETVPGGPLRTPIADPPRLLVAGFEKKCTECHDLFRSNPEQPLLLNQHRDIVQAHGMNDRCFNCHDGTDRARLVLPRGRTVPFSESARLCAKCHGTTYRDWELGMHGRTTGSWDATAPTFERLTCAQCHDPHAPAFERMATWPGPQTLRMGQPLPHEPDPSAHRNPLRQWSGRQEESEH